MGRRWSSLDRLYSFPSNVGPDAAARRSRDRRVGPDAPPDALTGGPSARSWSDAPSAPVHRPRHPLRRSCGRRPAPSNARIAPPAEILPPTPDGHVTVGVRARNPTLFPTPPSWPPSPSFLFPPSPSLPPPPLVAAARFCGASDRRWQASGPVRGRRRVR